MASFEKLGLRNFGLNVIDYINWIRIYGLKDGRLLYKSLRKPVDKAYKAKASFFKAPVELRNNNSDLAIFKQTFYDKQYEIYSKPFENAKTIIDAGANVGTASIYFSILFPQSKIISIEPEADNFRTLSANTKSYPNITILNAALWYKKEMLQISNPDSESAGFIVKEASSGAVEAYTLSEILEKYSIEKVDILKIDIEGAEREVFSMGDTSWIDKVNALIIELHDNYKPGCTKAFFSAISHREYDAYFHHENIFIFFK